MALPTVSAQCNAFFEPPNDYNCSECGDPMGMFTCHGCGKAFCPVHALEHRRSLKHRLQLLIRANQALDTRVDGHSGDRTKLELEINDWSAKSIQKIEQIAEEARRKLIDIESGRGNTQLKRINDCRLAFTTRLERADAKEDYHEQHLIYWEQFLEDLRHNYERFRTNIARIEFCSRPFIAKIIVVENQVAARFTKWCYYQKEAVQTTALRQSEYFQEEVAEFYIGPCERSTTYYREPEVRVSEIRAPIRVQEPHIAVLDSDFAGVLQTGEYRFRLSPECRFIGIISKTENAKNAPLNTPSVYGWATTEDVIYRDGQRQFGGSNDLHPGDTVSLLISSEQQLIRLKNITRNRTLELPIDLNKCQMPWQLKIGFSSSNYERSS